MYMTEKDASGKYEKPVLFLADFATKFNDGPFCATKDGQTIFFTRNSTNKRLRFLTNNFSLPALVIARLYKRRWQVELFFKWIKQYLRIKTFYGNSENAVKTQIWIAISVYVMIAILKKELRLDQSLGEILQILSVTLFEKIEISRLFSEFQDTSQPDESPKQLILNGI